MFRHVGNASADTLLMFRFLGSGTSRKTGHLYFVSAITDVHYCVASTLKRDFRAPNAPRKLCAKITFVELRFDVFLLKRKQKEKKTLGPVTRKNVRFGAFLADVNHVM